MYELFGKMHPATAETDNVVMGTKELMGIIPVCQSEISRRIKVWNSKLSPRSVNRIRFDKKLKGYTARYKSWKMFFKYVWESSKGSTKKKFLDSAEETSKAQTPTPAPAPSPANQGCDTCCGKCECDKEDIRQGNIEHFLPERGGEAPNKADIMEYLFGKNKESKSKTAKKTTPTSPIPQWKNREVKDTPLSEKEIHQALDNLFGEFIRKLFPEEEVAHIASLAEKMGFSSIASALEKK